MRFAGCEGRTTNRETRFEKLLSEIEIVRDWTYFTLGS